MSVTLARLKKVGVTSGSAAMLWLASKEYDYRMAVGQHFQEIDKQLTKIALDDSKWNALVDHENRLRVVEAQADISEKITTKFMNKVIGEWVPSPILPPFRSEGDEPADTTQQAPVNKEAFKEQHTKKGE